MKGKPVTVIAKYGFQGWDIKSVSIPDSITTIGDYAFQYCRKLTEVDIPSSVTVIGSSAFNECDKLNKITLHNGLKTVGKGAFYNTGEKIEELVIPDTVEIIKDYEFFSYIACVYVPKGVKEVGKSAFLSSIGTNYPVKIKCEPTGKPAGWDTSFFADNYGKTNLNDVVWGGYKK